VLRPWRDEDVEALVTIANDADVARYLDAGNFPHPYTREDAQSWIARCKGGEQFAIDVGGRLAGAIGIFPFTGERRHVAHIGYWLGKAFWGRGIATAACRCLVEHLFAATGLIRLETTVDAPNVASIRVLEKCGFVREGVKRSALLKDGVLHNVFIYAILRDEHPSTDSG
jgi:RimJ/RimL family protein N-acetyltransferase